MSDVPQKICDQLSAAGVTVVSSLPDTWVVHLINAVKEDPRFTHVGVSREESAIGICSGAFLGGQRAAAIMGTSGFMASIYAISKINFSYGIGFPILMNLRGGVGDKVPHHVSNGMLTIPVFNALGLPYEVIDRVEHLDRIPDLVDHSRLMKRPVCVCLGSSLWQ
jgi:sulfopyruvate decarboxylase subunit alpha